MVEVLIAGALVAAFVTTIFLVNMQCLRILKRGKEVTAAKYLLQERLEQLRAANLLNATNLISTNWLASTNFLGAPSQTATALPNYTESILVHPCNLTNTNQIVLDSSTWVGLANVHVDGVGTIGSVTEANYTNFTATNAARMVHVSMRLVWQPFGGGGRQLTNEVATTIIARGL